MRAAAPATPASRSGMRIAWRQVCLLGTAAGLLVVGMLASMDRLAPYTPRALMHSSSLFDYLMPEEQKAAVHGFQDAEGEDGGESTADALFPFAAELVNAGVAFVPPRLKGQDAADVIQEEAAADAGEGESDPEADGKEEDGEGATLIDAGSDGGGNDTYLDGGAGGNGTDGDAAMRAMLEGSRSPDAGDGVDTRRLRGNASEDALLSASSAIVCSGTSAMDLRVRLFVAPECVPMERANALRVLIALLPASAYGMTDDIALRAYAVVLEFEGMSQAAATAAASSTPPGVAALLTYTRTSSYSLQEVEFNRSISDGTLRRALFKHSRTAPELVSRMASIGHDRMAALAVTAEQGVAAFTDISQRDLERIYIRKMLERGTLVDVRGMTQAELLEADVIFVPFPLIEMRFRPVVAARFKAIMAAHVPSLFSKTLVRRHMFVFGRLFQDVTRLGSFRNSFRPVGTRSPYNRARYITTQASYMSRATSRRQITVPYPAVVRLLYDATHPLDALLRPGHVTSRGRLEGSVRTGLRLSYHPTISGDPELAMCEPACVLHGLGSPAGPSHPFSNCSRSQSGAALRSQRPLLASFLGETRAKVPERVSAINQLLKCSDCGVFDLSSSIFRGGYGMSLVYSTSVFCIQPHGDAPPRKAFFDSLMLGCIPVVLDRGDTVRGPILPFTTLLPWRRFAVLLSARQWEHGLIGKLRSFSPEVIRRMQTYLASVAHLMQYTWDAASFHTTVSAAVTERMRVMVEEGMTSLRAQEYSVHLNSSVNGTLAAGKSAMRAAAARAATLLGEAPSVPNAILAELQSRMDRSPPTTCARDAFDMTLARFAKTYKRPHAKRHK